MQTPKSTNLCNSHYVYCGMELVVFRHIWKCLSLMLSLKLCTKKTETKQDVFQCILKCLVIKLVIGTVF